MQHVGPVLDKKVLLIYNSGLQNIVHLLINVGFSQVIEKYLKMVIPQYFHYSSAGVASEPQHWQGHADRPHSGPLTLTLDKFQYTLYINWTIEVWHIIWLI